MTTTQAHPEAAANERWDGGVVDNEWKPRPRGWMVGDLEWVARMSDKARAQANGTIGEYIYPCPADKRCLEALELDPEAFKAIAVAAHGDDDLLHAVKSASPAIREGRHEFSIARK
ncbi:MAG: hypothetical protein RL345_1721 [Chloroflexota bacterium]|jgi:hypothetical protein